MTQTLKVDAIVKRNGIVRKIREFANSRIREFLSPLHRSAKRCNVELFRADFRSNDLTRSEVTFENANFSETRRGLRLLIFFQRFDDHYERL